MLDAVLNRGEPLDRAQHAATQGLPSHADRALSVAIAQETLRHLVDLDTLIDSVTQQPLAPDVKVKTVIRLALVQALILKTPPHAVLSTALPLLSGGPRRLAHGVLGTLFRGGAALPANPTVPAGMAEGWTSAWGYATVAAASHALATQPPLDLTLRDPATTENWTTALGGTSLMPGHVRVTAPGAITELPGFAEGAWWVQDIAASLPARLLGPGQGRNVLDLCAAPGGKSLQLAAAGWNVLALDKSQKRLERMRDNVARNGLDIETRAADILEWQPEAAVDAILLDAPCSATGIFRRHPDVLYRIVEREISELVALQAAMLDRCSAWVKPGGAMVFSTCSLEPAEGEEQIARFVRDHADWRLDALPAMPLPAGLSTDPRGYLRVLPGQIADPGGCDGFFMARLVRAPH